MSSFLSTIKDRRRLGYLTSGVLICVLLVFFITLPIVSVFLKSFQDKDGLFTLENYYNAFTMEETGNAIKNSLLLSLSVTGLSTLIAVPEAYILAKTKLKRLWWLDLVMMIPFMVPPYINSMGWMLFMQRNGILYRNFKFLRPMASSFFSFFGMVWIMSMHTSPFLMTMLKNAFMSFPKSIDDADSIYVRKGWTRFRKVYAPILFPNFLIGAFLVFVKALSEYGTPATFGPEINVLVFSTIITNKMQVAPIDFSMASSLASLLVTICMVLWLVQMYVTSKKTIALKDEGNGRITKSWTACILGSLFLVVLFFFSAFIPLFTIVVSSFKKTLYKNLNVPGNFTFDNYRIAFEGEEGFANGYEAIGNSFFIGIMSSLLILVVGVILAIFSFRNKKKLLGKGVEFLDMLPQMIPNIVTGIGMIMFFNLIYKAFPVYRTKWMLVIGYSVIFLPTMVSYIKNSLLQMQNSIIESANVYCKSNLKINLRIVLPQALKGAFYGFSMTFIVALRELVTAKLLQPPSFYTISLYIDRQFEQGNQQAAMALSVVSVLLTLLLLLPLEFFMGRKERKKV